MASSKSGKAKAEIVKRGENSGTVRGLSTSPSGHGFDRNSHGALTDAQLGKLLDLQFELEHKQPKGSSNTPSSEAAQRANIAKGGLR